MRELTQTNEDQNRAVKDWGYALILLAVISGLFLSLRVAGRAFIVLEFEVLVIHVPAIVCLLSYLKVTRSSRSAPLPSQKTYWKYHADLAI
jgi:uncharacterized SAM-binding protein YcdF (DUF218 family)